MEKTLAEVALMAYNQWKNKVNPPVPIPELKEFLENEGVILKNDENE